MAYGTFEERLERYRRILRDYNVGHGIADTPEQRELDDISAHVLAVAPPLSEADKVELRRLINPPRREP